MGRLFRLNGAGDGPAVAVAWAQLLAIGVTNKKKSHSLTHSLTNTRFTRSLTLVSSS